MVKTLERKERVFLRRSDWTVAYVDMTMMERQIMRKISTCLVRRGDFSELCSWGSIASVWFCTACCSVNGTRSRMSRIFIRRCLEIVNWTMENIYFVDVYRAYWDSVFFASKINFFIGKNERKKNAQKVFKKLTWHDADRIPGCADKLLRFFPLEWSEQCERNYQYQRPKNSELI